MDIHNDPARKKRRVTRKEETMFTNLKKAAAFLVVAIIAIIGVVSNIATAARTLLRLQEIWKVVAFVGSGLVIAGTGMKIFSFIPGLPHDVWEPAQFWGDVLPIAIGPAFLLLAGALYVGINRGPLPGTLGFIENAGLEGMAERPPLGWAIVWAICAVIGAALARASLKHLFVPGIGLVMKSAWAGSWGVALWQLPLLVAGFIGLAYSADLLVRPFFIIVEMFYSDEDEGVATENEVAA